MTLPNIEAKPAPEPLRHPEKAARPDQPSPRKPPWIRVKAPTSPEYQATRRLMRELKLNTVCEEAACPNIGECWKEKHATVMILGAVCTRACTFCNVATGRPDKLDPHEPARVGAAVAKLGLNHNVETVPRLYAEVRPGARYFHSLRLLDQAKRLDPTIFTKSGLMVGLGEARGEVLQVMDDLREAEVDFLIIGQYLQPTPKHHPIAGFVTPEEFEGYRRQALGKGFLMVSASPLTRSSYHAGEDFAQLKAACAAALAARA